MCKISVRASWRPVRNGGTAPRIRNIGIRRKWVVRFTSRPLYPQGKIPHYPLNKRQGGSLGQSVSFGENILLLLWIEPRFFDRTPRTRSPPTTYRFHQAYTESRVKILLFFLCYRIHPNAEIRKHQLCKRISYRPASETLNSSRGIVTGS
jgi:hypothetical protein